MRKILFLVLGLLALPLVSQADVLVYKAKITRTEIGATNNVKFSHTGWFMLDPISHEVVMVRVFSKTKTFEVVTLENTDFRYVQGAKTYSAIIAMPGPDFGGAFALGTLNKTQLAQGLLAPWPMPRVMTVSGTALTFANGIWFSQQFKGSLTYDANDTILANQGHYTMAQIADTCRQILLGTGFTEI